MLSIKIYILKACLKKRKVFVGTGRIAEKGASLLSHGREFHSLKRATKTDLSHGCTKHACNGDGTATKASLMIFKSQVSWFKERWSLKMLFIPICAFSKAFLVQLNGTKPQQMWIWPDVSFPGYLCWGCAPPYPSREKRSLLIVLLEKTLGMAYNCDLHDFSGTDRGGEKCGDAQSYLALITLTFGSSFLQWQM